MKVLQYFPGIQLFEISGNKFSIRFVWTTLFLFMVVYYPLFSENPLLQPVPPLNQVMNYNQAGSHTFTVPAGVTSITIETWGGGGRGGSRTTGTDGTGGGGGGAYSQQVFTVTPGQVLNVNVGAGSSSNTASGGDSWVSAGTVTSAFVLAKGGNSAASNTTAGATGGSSASGIGTIKFSGGNGANRVSTTSSGGGGSSGGSAANGTNASGTTGGVAPANGGNGANGRTSAGSGTTGSSPGGGGSGAVRGSTGSPAGGNGGTGRVVISYNVNIDAGPDQSQCQNARFVLKSEIPPSGYSITWSVVSGTGFIYDNSNPTAEVTVPSGNTATIRLSVSNGTTTINDDVVLTNTTSCTTSCTNPLNSNGDFELRGTATADNLSFQGTPATLIYQTTNPIGWSERYGSSSPNTTAFTGAYYINKTGTNGNPKSGSRMIYMAGEGFCLSALKTFADLTCGRTYRVSVWVAAFTNSSTQTTSTFAMEYISGGNTVPDLHIGNYFVAPASTSWNNLNWQRYSFEVTIPSAGYEYTDFLFTTLHNVNGIVIDDMCIEEVFSASRANAGIDQFNCTNSFTLAANTPPSGYAGVWSVVSGSASVSNSSSPTSTATISSGNNARLRWTVNGTGGTRRYTAIDPATIGGFESCCSPYDNGWTAINHGTNNWYTGNVPGAYSGSNAAYISNNGGTNHTYSLTTAQTSHLYRDVKIHPDANNITLSFQWKGMGQASTDRLLVYTAPTSVDPVAGVPASTSTTLTGATLVSSTNLTSSPFYKNATITLPNSLAGTTVRLIFTWQNNNATGTNSPAAIDDISLSYNLPVCSDSDEVNLLYNANTPLTLNNVTICPGTSATLTPTGCSGGSLLWSTGATSSSITVSPASTTNYSVTCTPATSVNLLNNPGFESSTNLQYWDNWQGGSITTTAADVHSGAKALKLNALVTEYAGVAQGMDITPGKKYKVGFYAKTNNSNALPVVRYQFWDNSSNKIEDGEGVLITSTSYQYYSFEFVTHPNASWLSVFAEISGKGQLFVDSWEVVSINSCQSSVTSTVVVNNTQCPTIFICDSKFYQTREINGEYFLNSIETKPSVRINQLANLTQNGVIDGINSIVFNKTDGFIYGLAMTAPFHLYRIGSNFVVQNLGIVQGFPSDAFVNAADIVNGNIIYRNANDEDLYQLNFNTLVVTKLCDFSFTQAPQSNVGDIAHNPIDGRLYGTRDNSRKLVKYNLSNCTFQEITLSDSIIAAHGAFFISADGVGYGYQNATGKFTEINLSTGLVRTVGQDILTAQTDGCSCDGIKFTKTVSVASTKTCNTFTYIFNFYNQWTGPVTNVLFRDTLTNNLIWSSNPKNIQNLTLGTTSIIGSDKTNFTINSIPVGFSTFSIDVHVPQTYDGGNIYSNQAYIHNLPALLPNTKPSDNPLTAAIEDATTIIINPSDLVVNHSGNVSICSGTSTIISATASGGTGSGYSYQWSPSAGLSAINISNPLATPSGTTTYTVTVTDANGCTKTSSLTVSILSNPTAPVLGTITHPTCTTPTGSVVLNGLPSTGSWIITRTPGGNTYSGSGTSYTVNGLPPNTTYSFTVKNINNCTSLTSNNVVINAVPTPPSAAGASTVCVGVTANVTPGTNGTWTSSNTAIATITNAGVISGISAGSVTFTYTRTADGCTATWPFTVLANPTAPLIGTITQPTCSTPTGSIILNGLPSTGSWTITRLPGGTTYSGSGTSYTVTGLPSNTTYTFRVTNTNFCTSVPSSDVVINTPPSAPSLGGAAAVCAGSFANVTPSANGTWTSSNNTIATITNAGVVNGLTAGSVTLTYTRTSDGCSISIPFTVYALPSAPVVGTITHPTCITTTGSVILTGLPSSGTWTIIRTPGNITYTGTGTSYTVNGLTPNTSFTFTVTNADLCTSISSTNVAINAIPANPVLGGATSVCAGATTNVTPSSNGTWSSANNSIATVTNAGLVTGVTAGSVILTYTRTSDGCANTLPFSVLANPSAPVPGTVTQPTCTTPTGSVVLSGLPSSGSWTITRSPGGNTYTGTGTGYTLTGLPANATYTLTVTNSNLCTSPSSTIITINAVPGAPVVGGASSICAGLTANVTPTSNGTWASSNNSVATVSNSGLVTAISSGAVTLTYTRSSDGCSNTLPFTVFAIPTAPVAGTITQPNCTQPTGSVVLTGLPSSGNWIITRMPGAATYSGTGTSYTVTGLSDDTDYTFTVTNSNNCISPSSAVVTINRIPSIPNLGGPESACVGSTVTVTPTNQGTWSSSNNAIATINNTGLVTAISPGTVNLVYTRSSNGCIGTKDFTVFAIPSAPVTGTITQPTCAVTTGSVVLNGLPSSGTWTLTRTPGGNTYTGTGTSYTVTGLAVGTSYTFTVRTPENCTSLPSAPVVINSVPNAPSAAINYMGSLCITDNKQISADVSGGASPYTYLWTGPSGFTGNTNTITITQFGTYNVTVTDANLCKTSVSGYVNERYNPVIINLQSTVCEGENVFLDINTNSGVSYVWSANAGSATTKSVTVTPAPPSTTYLVTVTNNIGCTAVPTVTVNVNPKPVVSVSGASGLCPGQTTNLLPSTGGTWTSSNPAVATVTNAGLVTAISQGTATFIFTNSVTNCSSDATTPVTVNPGPVITLNGPANICVGNTTQLLPSSGGTWTSSNPAVATINSTGVINGISPGSAQFTYTNSVTGCVSNASTNIQVGPSLSATIDYNGNICLTDTSKLSLIITGGTPNYTYTWTGPLSFTGNTSIVNISSNGNYNVTVSDSYGCKANVSGYVYQRFDPYIVNLGSTICEGQSVNLSVNASSAVSYLWGPNAGNNTSSSVTVFPLPPLTNYFVTVTNDLGCKAVANAAVIVHPKPIINITGSNPICAGQTSQLSPNTGGTWVSLNPAIASVTNTGLITGISQGTVRFIFTQAVTNCVSDTSQTLEVKSATSTNFDGPNTLCTGQQTNVQPYSGGSWTSLHPHIATVSTNGTVTSVSPGVASLRFTNSAGCITGNDLSLIVYDKPAVLLDGPNQICPGSTTQMLPTTGGTWTSTHPGVATISNAGLITGISSGTSRFIFTSTFSGCISDTSVVITVKPPTSVSVAGSDIICAGNQTTLSPSSGGMWVSNNPAIASVNNQGIVTGISNGTATFTFFDFAGGCPSLPTAPVTVNAKPIVSVSGPTDICIGGVSNLLPATGGTWTSSNPAIASVTNSGIVTGLAPGTANFIFTNTTTGCVSLPSPAFTVYSKPTISITNNTVCVGNAAQLTPSTGGTWTSSNTSVATVSGTGLVNAIAAGNASFTFTEHGSGCTSDPGGNVTVLSKPIINIVGPATICPGQTTQLIPASGGTWTSEFPGIASVNNTGLVTGLSGGTTRFIFTSTSGCQSDPGAGVTINEKPNISISGPGTLCIGATTQLSPSNGGTWISSNPASATVTNEGLVTAISSGTTKFIFTHSGTGCASDSSALLTVSTSPDIIMAGSGEICIEQTTQLSPSTGGIWVSLHPSVASVTNTGLVTGISAGITGFRFIQSSTGCEAVLPDALTVLPKPVVEVTGTQAICMGGTTNLSPTTGGTWASMNPLVAVVNHSGAVTGISPGTATFRFTLTSTGCTSNVSVPVTVLSATTPVLDGPSSICKGSTTQFLPNTGGTWSSSNTMVATISSSGLVTAMAQGNVYFFFTDAITGCISNPSSAITVYPDTDVFVSGPTNLCIGYQTILGSSSAGVWNSTRSAIAPTTSNGLVTGNAPGKVTFYFTEASTGCVTYLPEDIITVTNCFDPDFNVTLVNVPLNGNVATNDETPSGTSYHNTYYLISKPAGSNPSLVISPNGNYTFQSDLPGVYEFETKICYQGIILNCPGSNLVIHVVNSFSEKQTVIPNTDILSIYENENAGIITTFNDRCIMGADCNIDTTKISITSLNANGNVILSTNGNTNYTPDQDFIGQDTIIYNVCASNDNTNCKTSKQIVTVMAANANNTLVAGDDFFILFKGGSIENKNLLENDFDPENETFSIIPQGSVSNKITVAAGQYYILADGQLFFTPNPQFTGPVDIIYTICDNQNFCVKATAHILVLDNLKLRVRAYLEGALMENGDARASDNRPLMRDDLRVGPVTGLNCIPSKDPYSYPTLYNDISVLYTHVGAGSGLEYRNISDSAAVFGVTGENAIVDWVFVELRSKNDYGNVLATRSALIQRDGDVVDLDGISFVAFPGLAADSCYVILKHRNHLGVMSSKVSVNSLVDFTLPSTPTFDFGNSLNDGYDYSGLSQKAGVVQDYMALWAGDFDGNGKIKFVNPGDDHNMLFIEVLTYPTNIEFTANYNFAYGYLQGDYNLNGKSKYDNPDDDKNMLFYQILFYPLNEGYISNFNNFIQQIPPANRE
jgi:uncharacterized protein YjdB